MKAFFSVHNGIILALFFFPLSNKAQSRSEVGNTVEFAGTIVSLNEQGRQRLQQEVDRLYANRGEVNNQLEQLRQLDPLIQIAMRKAGLPVDFRFLLLPFDAQQGYWNSPDILLPQLGLSQTAVIDEQRHPLLATEAVAVYLARLYQRNGNSLRTVIQYLQAGDPLQTERLSASGTYALLDPNSPAAVWKLLARRLVFNQEEPAFRPNKTFVLWMHEHGNGKTLTDIAFQYNLPTDRLQPFDKWLRGPVIPAECYFPVLIRMLPEEYATVIGRIENAKQNSPSPDLGFPVLRRMSPTNSVLNTPIVLYEINSLPGIQAQPGDNAITLAFYGDISVRKFLEYNDMTEQNVVRPGEIYYLGPKLRRAKVPFHVLSRGQTMREVANVYGVQLKYLLRYNDLETNSSVAEGRVIWLQRSRPRNQAIEYRQVERPQQPPISSPDSIVAIAVAVVDSTQENTISRVDSDLLQTDSTNTVSLSTSVNSSTPVIRDARVDPKTRLGNATAGRQPRSGDAVKTTPRPARPPEQKMKTILRIEQIPIDQPARKSLAAQYYIVQPGQTVYRVALINKVTIAQVMRLNNLRNYTIEVGQRIRVR